MVLRLDSVTVVRDGATLLSDIHWTVADGERWVILGPNGAGKTTLLQVAASRVFPTRGTVDLLGGRLGEVDVFDLRSRVGLASSAVADLLPATERVLDVVMTAAWAVLGRATEKYTDDDRWRALELLAQVGCGNLAERRYGTLSEGERKRVQIARALMTDPELLLMDEPAAGLDLGAREALLVRLTRLVADPLSPVTIMVSHHVEEIPPGVTHALLLRAGRVVAAGPVETVLTGPTLSACFGIPLEVGAGAGRFSARLMPVFQHSGRTAPSV
ncbi:ABC transporter related protein [Candidatus Protofrankia datiscae]|uniref:ABC transporter related protein n=2 Tax=Protofrankia TaxID=2994361 RepID=F8B372_9ACTN|nr:ABC transporter related protein [Candidatus Protofrankia datiscae]KLL12976.1 iron ABC transporter ATP-binding protein [Protofrankia coriariae]